MTGDSKSKDSRHSDMLRTRRSGDRIPVGSEIFLIRPERTWGVLPAQCIYVFCVDLRTNSDYFPIHH